MSNWQLPRYSHIFPYSNTYGKYNGTSYSNIANIGRYVYYKRIYNHDCPMSTTSTGKSTDQTKNVFTLHF